MTTSTDWIKSTFLGALVPCGLAIMTQPNGWIIALGIMGAACVISFLIWVWDTIIYDQS